MIVDTLLEQSSKTNRKVTIDSAPGTDYSFENESLHGESWMDDLYETDLYSINKVSDIDSWMENLDEFNY
jgi:hypothetical protein